MRNSKIRLNNGVGIAFVSSFILHMIPIFLIKLPSSAPDELGTMSLAAYLAGNDWSFLTSSHGAYYGYGSFWFLFPLFKLIDNSYLIYTIFRIVAAVYLSIPSIIAYIILKKYYNLDNEITIIVGAITCSFFSNITGDVLINEALLSLLGWLIIYLLLAIDEAENKQKKFYSFLVGIVAIYALTVHTRGIILLGILYFLIFIYALLKRKFIVKMLFFMLANLLLPLVFYINKIVEKFFFTTSGKEASGTTDALSTLSGNSLLVYEIRGLETTLQGLKTVFITNFWGIVVFSGGLFILIFVIYFYELRTLFLKKEMDLKVNLPIIFAGTGILGTLFAFSVIQVWHGVALNVGENFGDGRFFFYLRYYINFLPPLFLTILYYINKKKINYKFCFLCIIVYVFSLKLFFDYFVEVVERNGIKPFDVGSLFSFFTQGIYNEISIGSYYIVAIVISILFLLLLFLSLKNKINLFIFIILILMCHEQLYKCVEFKKPISDNAYAHLNKVSDIFVGDSEFMDEVDTLYAYSKVIYRYECYVQLLFPKITVKKYSGETDEEKLILSDQVLTLDGYYEAVIDKDEYLYTNSNKYKEYIESKYSEISFAYKEGE